MECALLHTQTKTHLGCSEFLYSIAGTMRQRHSCISHGSNVEHNALLSWHAKMYKFVTSMVRCVLGMQQCPMHNATIQKITFFLIRCFVQTKMFSLTTMFMKIMFRLHFLAGMAVEDVVSANLVYKKIHATKEN